MSRDREHILTVFMGVSHHFNHPEVATANQGSGILERTTSRF